MINVFSNNVPVAHINSYVDHPLWNSLIQQHGLRLSA